MAGVAHFQRGPQNSRIRRALSSVIEAMSASSHRLAVPVCPPGPSSPSGLPIADAESFRKRKPTIRPVRSFMAWLPVSLDDVSALIMNLRREMNGLKTVKAHGRIGFPNSVIREFNVKSAVGRCLSRRTQRCRNANSTCLASGA